MNDYERSADVIRLMDRRRTEEPNLETLADRLDLSTHRFSSAVYALGGRDT